MRKFNLIVFAVLSMFVITFSSCEDDEEYMVVDYEYSCSPDLLEFVTPTIHYLDNNGVQQDVSLKKEDFKTKSHGTTTLDLTINGNTSTCTKEFVDNIWNFKKRYDGWVAKDEIKVTYELKDGISIDPEKKYSFFHSKCNYTCNVYSDGTLVHTYYKSAVPTETIVQGEADVRDYLSVIAMKEISFKMDLTASYKESEK